MKKLLGVVALTGLLASCASTVVGNDATLDSEFYVSNQSFQGGTYSGPVICDDRYTQLSFSFSYLGDRPSTVDATLVGSMGERKAPQVTGYDDSGNQLTIYFTANPGSVPLSAGGGLKAQAIVPTPITNPKIIGATQVLFTVNPTQGASTTEETQFVPVIDNCPSS